MKTSHLAASAATSPSLRPALLSPRVAHRPAVNHGPGAEGDKKKEDEGENVSVHGGGGGGAMGVDGYAVKL